jgi:hypothetical protein
MKKAAIFISLLLLAGTALAGQTIIQKGNIITDVFSATALFVERVSGHQLKGDIDASGNLVKNLAEPVNQQDAATKAYVDEVAKGIGLKCDGPYHPEHSGTPLYCEAKQIFDGPARNVSVPTEKTCGNLPCYETKLVPLCPNKATADKWCQEEGYTEAEIVESGFVNLCFARALTYVGKYKGSKWVGMEGISAMFDDDCGGIISWGGCNRWPHRQGYSVIRRLSCK